MKVRGFKLYTCEQIRGKIILMPEPIKQTTEEIFTRQGEIEREIRELLARTGSDFTLEDVKQVIYDEQESDDMMKAVRMFDNGLGVADLSDVLETVTDAWNYFSHKTLNGLSPAEMALAYRTGEERGSNSRE